MAAAKNPSRGPQEGQNLEGAQPKKRVKKTPVRKTARKASAPKRKSAPAVKAVRPAAFAPKIEPIESKKIEPKKDEMLKSQAKENILKAINDFSKEQNKAESVEKVETQKTSFSKYNSARPGLNNESEIKINQKADFETSENHDEVINKAKKIMLGNQFNHESAPHTGLYRKIALTFVFLVLVLLAVVFYFSFVKIKITIVPSQEKINDNMTFAVLKGVVGSDQGITGAVENMNLNEDITYQATGERIISQEVGGQVTIYNKYIKNQPLVASTRLLSTEGKLFRTRQTVNVPAGGQVTVEVYADKSDDTMAIGPSHFTLPGLWAGLQDKIYAESTEAMGKKKDAKHYITAEDIKAAEEKAKQDVLAKIEEATNVKYPQFDGVAVQLDEVATKLETDAKAEDEKENFKMKIEAQAEVVAFAKNEAANFIKNKYLLTLPQGKQIVSISLENYELVNFDAKAGRSDLKTNFSGKLAATEGSTLINPKDLAGLTKPQLEIYLKDKEGIADYEIKFYPSFVSRVPNLVDRIQVEVVKQ